MNSLALMAGTDVPVLELQTVIHQPRIKEIALIGEEEYFLALQLLCFNRKVLLASQQAQGALSLASMNNFQIFMTLVANPQIKDSGKRKGTIEQLFVLFFPGYTAQFLPMGIYFNNATTKHSFVLDERTFDVVQQLLSDVSGLNNTTGGQNSNYNPKGNKAAQIAAKLMKGRSEAAKRRGDNKSDGVLARYVSILTIALESMSLDDCLNLTVYQLYDLIERYGLYVGWDLDIKSRLAGGKPDNKPDDWMKSLH